jgi:uncharacterized peroxidase-related enzyme
MGLSPGLGLHLRGLADALLVQEFPGSSLTRAHRELLATAVSAENGCFFCMDSHGAFAGELLARERTPGAETLVEGLKVGSSAGLDGRLVALLHLARIVTRDPRALRQDEVEAARAAGASEGDIQLAILIASAFCMYNRMVDGLRAGTAPTTAPYHETAKRIADHGYQEPPPAR